MVSEALPADGRPLSTPAMLLAVDIGNTNVVFGVFDGTGWRPAQPLPVARQLGETSLMFLVHPTLTPAEIDKTCLVIGEVLTAASTSPHTA